MTQNTLVELALRVEQQLGAARDIDACIAVAIKLGARGLLPDDHEYLSVPRKDDNCTPGTYWFHCRSGKSLQMAPEFTRSIDAASRLVPDGWDWSAGTAGDAKGGHSFCQSADGLTEVVQDAATPALALVAASLRARSQALSEGEGE